MFVGWDWGNSAHDVAVMDDDGRLVDKWKITHTEEGLDAALRRLAKYDDPAKLPVAIEASRGLVVDRLLAAGHPVVPVDTRAFNAMRPRWGASRAKNDAGDAFKLADYLRTDRHTLRVLPPTRPETMELQALSRLRSDHVAAKVTVINQLHALLGAHFPGACRLFKQLDSDIAMAFLDRFPTPQHLDGVDPGEVHAFLRQHRYRSRTGEQVLHRVATAPAAASRISSRVVAELVRSQVRILRAIVGQIRHLDEVIADALARHPYAHLFARLPRIGAVNFGQVLAEVGPMLERGATAEQLACEVGMAPVTRESGTIRNVTFRRAVNLNARQAFVVFVNNSRFDNPWAAQLYRAARDRGKRHPHAARILGRAWLRVIHTCWRHQTPYDPNRHATAADPPLHTANQPPSS
jgi:transposase